MIDNREVFIKYIETLGFKRKKINYTYKKYEIIATYSNRYHFCDYNFGNNGYYCSRFNYDDLTPLKQISRNKKLKQLLR